MVLSFQQQKYRRNAQPMPKHPSGALGRRADQYFVYLTKQHTHTFQTDTLATKKK